MVTHSDPTIAELCPVCNPTRVAQKQIRGKAFFEHIQSEWERMGRDGAFTPAEKTAFFETIRAFLVGEKLLAG